jgi:hypothetical protein
VLSTVVSVGAPMVQAFSHLSNLVSDELPYHSDHLRRRIICSHTELAEVSYHLSAVLFKTGGSVLPIAIILIIVVF